MTKKLKKDDDHPKDLVVKGEWIEVSANGTHCPVCSRLMSVMVHPTSVPLGEFRPTYAFCTKCDKVFQLKSSED